MGRGQGVPSALAMTMVRVSDLTPRHHWASPSLVWEKMADKIRRHGRRDHGLMSTLAALSAKVCQASCRAKWKRPSSSRMPSSH